MCESRPILFANERDVPEYQGIVKYPLGSA